MAHFAQLDENNNVLRVLVVSNSDINDLPFPESEPVGISYLQNLMPGTVWAQTSYNNNFRVRYAGIGLVFYPNCQATPYGGFGNKKPSDEWVWDDSLCLWTLPRPDDGQNYIWDFVVNVWIAYPAEQGA